MTHALIKTSAILLLVVLAPRWGTAQLNNSRPADAVTDKPLINDGLSKLRPAEVGGNAQPEPLSVAELDQKFENLFSGAILKGSFTTDGKPLTELKPDGYEIKKVHKLKPDGDLWAIHASIQYDGRNMVIPVPVHVLWAGSTPVIVLDDMMVPGYGKFSARIVFHGTRYAGTWQHDAEGGHLFGTIEYKSSESKHDIQSESTETDVDSKGVDAIEKPE